MLLYLPLLSIPTMEFSVSLPAARGMAPMVRCSALAKFSEARTEVGLRVVAPIAPCSQ